MKKKNILFICKFNQTRSQIARVIFQKLNKNKNIKADCAGVIKAGQSKEIRDAHKHIFKKYNIKPKKFKFLTKELLNKQTHVVVIADDVPLSLFDSQKKAGIKVIRLAAKDGHKYRQKTRRKRFEQVYLDVERKIKNFIKNGQR